MKSYKGEVKSNNSQNQELKNRSLLINYFRYVDRSIEQWVNHLIGEIEELHKKPEEMAG